MEVAHGRAEVAVAEQALHGMQIGAGFEHMGGEGMAEPIRILLMNRPRSGFATASIHSLAPRFS